MFLIILLLGIIAIVVSLLLSKNQKINNGENKENKEQGLNNPDFLNHTYDYKTELERCGANQIKSQACDYYYKYKKKNSIMTNAEERCFIRLNNIFGQKFYIVPQVHLSALFDYKVKGQNWKGAFSHINGKSVDFVLINKETFVPVCAVELDDYTHSFGDRKARDDEVERIFEIAKLPLVRFESLRDKTDKEVVAYFAARINK